MAVPAIKKFIGCRTCGCMTPIVLPGAHDAPETVEAYLQDWYGFFADHARHDLVDLSADADGLASGGPVWDPMAELVFEVHAQMESFIARATRASIDLPRTYRFAPGKLSVEASTVEIDEADVRTALDLELYPHVLRGSQIDQLLGVLHDSLGTIAAEELEIAFEDVDDPEISIAALPEPAFRRVLDASARIFDDWERPRVARFLEENRREDGLLALRVRRRVTSGVGAHS